MLVEVTEDVVAVGEDEVVVTELSLVEAVVLGEVVGVEVDLLLEVIVFDVVTFPVVDFEDETELVLEPVLEALVECEVRVVEVSVVHDVVEVVTELDSVELGGVLVVELEEEAEPVLELVVETFVEREECVVEDVTDLLDVVELDGVEVDLLLDLVTVVHVV